MAIVDGRTLLNNANSTTGFTAMGGVTLNSDTDTFIYDAGGTGASVAVTSDNTGGGEGIYIDVSADRDWTGEIVYIWVNIANPGLMEIKSAGGIAVRAANNAGVANYVERWIAGSDTYSGGWKMFVIDMDDLFANADATGGTRPSIQAARYVGIALNLITGAMPKMQDNLFVDGSWRILKSLPGIRVEGQDGGNPWTWAGIVDAADVADPSKAWGTVQKIEENIVLTTSIEFGDGAGTSTTEFTDTTGALVTFGNEILPEDYYAITVVGNGTGNTDIDFGQVIGTGDARQGIGGTIFRAAGPAYSFDGETGIVNLTSLNVYGCSFTDCRQFKVTGSTVTDVIGTSFTACGEVESNNAEFLNNNIVAPNDRGLEMLSTHNVKQTNFIAGSETNVVSEFGSSTTSTSASPSNPHTFNHTVASGQLNVALLVMIGWEDAANAEVILGMSYDGNRMQQIDQFKNGGSNVAAFILYDPPEGSALSVSVFWQGTSASIASAANIVVVARNYEGIGAFSAIRTDTGFATAGTAMSTVINGVPNASISTDLVLNRESSNATTHDATGGSATEVADAAITGEASYAVSNDTAGAGQRDHDWTWTNSANATQLVVVIPSIAEEHHVHHNNIGDATVTYEGMLFFGFGASGTPKWHGEISESASDVTISPTEGSDPLEAEFELTGSPTAPTVTVTAVAVTTLVHVADNLTADLQNARVLLEAGDAAGDFPYFETVTITRSGATASVAHTAHGMVNNDIMVIRGAEQPEYNGPHSITNVTANAYDYTVSGTPTTPATGRRLAHNQDETSYDNTPTTEGVFFGGAGHSVSDVLIVGVAGIKVTVDAVSTGVITQFTVDASQTPKGCAAGDVLTQRSSTGTGTGFTLTPDTDNIVIQASGAILNGNTDVNGDISASRVFTTDTVVKGTVRKSTASPRFKNFPLTGTIDNVTGLTINVQMVPDE